MYYIYNMYVYVCVYVYIYILLYTNARIDDHPGPSLHLHIWGEKITCIQVFTKTVAVGRGLGSPWLRPSTLTLEGSKKDALEVFGVVLVIARWGSLDFIWVTSFPPSLPNRLIVFEATNESFFMLMVKMPNQQPHDVDMCNVYIVSFIVVWQTNKDTY